MSFRSHAMALVGISAPHCDIAAVDEDLLALKCLFIWSPLPHVGILGDSSAGANSVRAPESRLTSTEREKDVIFGRV